MLYWKIESKNNQDFNTNLSHPNVELTWIDAIAWLLPLTLEPLTIFFSKNNPRKINKFTKIYIRCNSCTDSYGYSVWVGIHILGDLWHCFTHLKWSDWAGMFNNLWKKGRIDGVSINYLMILSCERVLYFEFLFYSLLLHSAEKKLNIIFTFKFPKQKNLEVGSLSSLCLLLTLT